MEEVVEILNKIKDMVIVTGSYAEGKETNSSDIDLYIRNLPEEECDYEKGIDTYSERIQDMLKEMGHELSSCYPCTFMDYSTAIPLDFSPFFQINENHIEKKVICGVEMDCSKSLYRGE